MRRYISGEKAVVTVANLTSSWRDPCLTDLLNSTEPFEFFALDDLKLKKPKPYRQEAQRKYQERPMSLSTIFQAAV